MMRITTVLTALAGVMLASAVDICDTASLNTTSFDYFNDIANQTVYEMAVKFKRGVCDIGRANLMVDVSVVPNVGQIIIIPGETCEPDWTTCIIDSPGTNDCLIGGPRLYYTLNGDTLWKIAGRLNMTVDAVQCGGTGCNTNVTCANGICPGGGGSKYSVNETIPAGEFIKIPMCYPSACDIEPYSFTAGVYKDLAGMFGSTVGQIQMLSPTYNYSSFASEGGSPPAIAVAKNCRLLAQNYTIVD